MLTPQIRLPEVLTGLVPDTYHVDRLIVASPEYMTRLSKVISETSKEVLQTFFIWKTIQHFAQNVESDALKPYVRFRNELQGRDPDSKTERWRTCVAHVDGGLGWILSRFYVEKAFSEKAKNFGDQIVSDIKDTFIERLKDTEWMDKSVVKLAIDKVHQIVQKIGYPTKVYITPPLETHAAMRI